MPDKNDEHVRLLLVFFIIVATSLLAMLVMFNKNPDAFIRYLFTIIPLAVGIGAVSRQAESVRKRVDQMTDKTDAQTEMLENVQHQTNGRLDAQFAAVYEKINEVHDDIKEKQP